MFKQLRRLFVPLFPIAPPEIIELPCDELKADFGDLTVNVPMLTRPVISNDLCQIPATPKPKARFTPLPRPQLLSIPTTLTPPQLYEVSLYFEIRGQKGKVYTDGEASNLSEYNVCEHGVLRYRCPTCSDQITPKRSSAKLLDEFDLLPPYLYPPLEDLLKLSSLWLEKIKPYDYQIEGIDFLVRHPAALLGDEMGLGKTIQAIIALWATFARGHAFKGLIVCRRTLLANWERELKIWAPVFLFQRVHGARNEREQLWQTPASIYLTTYDTLREDIERITFLKTKFEHGAIVLDEVQDIKNPNIKKTRAVHQVTAKYRWGLSGTPIENKSADIVTIFNYLKPDLFPPQPTMSDAEIKQQIQPYFFRRRIKDVQPELPDKITRQIWLELTPEQRVAYNQAYHKGRTELVQTKATRIHIFALINQLKQICNYEAAHQTSAKLDYILDELETVMANKQKALIFSQFPIKTFEAILPRLQPFDPAIYDGSLSDTQREQILDRFQNQASPQVLLISTKAGGVGLNLQQANHVFHFDHLWNPAAQHQATGRAHRTGQTQTVFVHDLFTKETIEERIQNILLQKQYLFDALIDDLSAEYVQGKFTDAELFALFELPPPEK